LACRPEARARWSAPESGASLSQTCVEVGDDPDGRASPVSERGRGRGGRAAVRATCARELGRARGEEEKKEMGCMEELGCTVEKEKKKGLGRLGWAAREKKREKGKGKVGRAQLEKREKKNCIQMHLNLNLKFKFKWKTNYKTMQQGMRCTKPIISYISFYGLVNCY
jgi:hypothetical protein